MLKSMICALALVLPAVANAGNVSGIYRTEKNEDGAYLLIKFGACHNNGALTCGIIHRAVDAKGTVTTDYEHIGKAIVWNMKDRGNGKYGSGKIWAPDTNKTYSSKMEFKGKNLKVSGCVAIICRAQTWTPN